MRWMSAHPHNGVILCPIGLFFSLLKIEMEQNVHLFLNRDSPD